ncbi:MAG: YbjN domain-containing protein [Erythrobacter sp.]|uniref:YbjN domain-containing protein n=1 Tax=Erythrobacter sp. TaxID=1042 RepID=UPI0032EFDBEB
MIDAVTIDDLKAIIGDIGHEIVSTETESAPMIVARTPDGVIYTLQGRACDDAKSSCKGITIQALYRGADKVTDEDIGRANQSFAVVKAAVNRERDNYSFTRYLILDHGVTMANIRMNVTVFLLVQPKSLKIAEDRSE